MKNILLLLLLSLTSITVFSQKEITNNIRGTVVDMVTNAPLPGATIILLNSDPIKGSVSDINGHFKLDNVAIGRVGIKVSYIGYKDRYYNNLELFAAKELVLNISLEEKIFTTEAVEIVAKANKLRPKNEIATVSARTFSVEETQRYAGSLGDPSRMAQNYAGVMSAGDSRNDIVIRGNSPMGLLWRMEGIDIPNPNHFGASGTTGGPVSMLNNNLLSNSDFFTGAFPAEYGNALSGVFDLQMRNGNNQNHEFVGQIGFNGFELGAEGPFSKNSQASYLINYRYSTLAVFEKLGLKSIVGSSVPQYQDLTFKLNLPTKNAGRFVLYGIGGTSFIQLWDSEKEEDEVSYGMSGTDTDFGSEMGVVGFYNVYYINKNTRLKTNLSVSGTRATTAIDSLKGADQIKSQFYRSSNSEVKYSLSTHLTHKFSAKDMIITGIIFDRYNINFIDSAYHWKADHYFSDSDTKGGLNIFQTYAQWKHKFNENLNFNVGLHYQYFDLNGSQTLEPRAGMEYRFTKKQSLSFGYGLHSQTQPKVLYFVHTDLGNGVTTQTNKDLDFTQSSQFVLAYNNLIGKNLRFKAEAYYQNLSNAPISKSASEQNYSALNAGADFHIYLVDSLLSQGTGTNYGIELTIEKFLSKHFYLLGTASLFRSFYKGYNKIEHSTVFDNRYVFNALGGYEIPIGKASRINIDLKGTYAGGKPYTPIDEEKSRQQNSTYYISDEAYSKQHPAYFRIDAKISFRMSMGHVDQEWAFEVQNVTNHQNVMQQTWDPINNELRTDYQQGFFPMFMYRIYF